MEYLLAKKARLEKTMTTEPEECLQIAAYIELMSVNRALAAIWPR